MHITLPPPPDHRLAEHEKALLSMHSVALALSHVCIPLEKLQRALGHAIATRMRAREGKFIWQTGNGHVENFPRAAADQLLAEEYVIGTSTALVKRWSATTMPAVVQMARPLIETSDFYSAGATRALLTPSERVIRVVATLIPMLNLKWWRGNLYYTFQYVLADEMGDLHSPKDENGIEIALSGALEVALRQQILADLNMMHNRGAPLGAGFLRQLGHISEALVLEAKLTKQNATPVTSCLSKLPGGGVKKRRASLNATTWEIACIHEEKAATRAMEASFLVEWSGYHPSWEAWRISGNVGEPISTWEPWSTVKNTEALQQWQAQLQ